MKKYTKQELTQTSKEIFDRKPEINELIAIEDGQFFLSSTEIASIDVHCKVHNLQKFTITREEAASVATDDKKEQKPAKKK